MIDTVVLESPPLSEEIACLVELFCERRSSVENRTGTVLWEFTTGSLKGSFDHRVSVKVKRERYESVKSAPGVPALTMLRACAPYIVVEGSIHKAIQGHNIYGGPLDPVSACRWLIDEVSRRLGLVLPCGLDWFVSRIDWAEVYEMPSVAAVVEYLRGLQVAEYPKRKVSQYIGESLMFQGKTTSFKLYAKGFEFAKNDKDRLKNCGMDNLFVENLHIRALTCLRVETSIKSKKLSSDFEGKPKVSQLSIDYLEGVHDIEVQRVIRQADSTLSVVNTALEVRRRLADNYPQALATSLYGAWADFATRGEKATREFMTKTTFYRQRQQLIMAGCSWLNTDVRIVPNHSPIPAGFSPVRSDPRRLTTESPEVEQALSPYRLPAPKV